MKVFIPITDEMLEKGLIPDDLVAFRHGQLLMSQFQTSPQATQSKSINNRSPMSTPSSDAVPALSSRTYMAGLMLG